MIELRVRFSPSVIKAKYVKKRKGHVFKIDVRIIFFVGSLIYFRFLHFYCYKNIIFAVVKVNKMGNKDLNRLKVVLAEKKHTNKWLAEQLGKDPATVSKWCTNSAQPSLENLLDIAKCLEVDIADLVRL